VNSGVQYCNHGWNKQVIAYWHVLLSSETKWLSKGISQIYIFLIIKNTLTKAKKFKILAHEDLIIISSLYAAIFVFIIKYLIQKGYKCNNFVYFIYDCNVCDCLMVHRWWQWVSVVNRTSGITCFSQYLLITMLLCGIDQFFQL